jgi:hypothetical protein
VDFQCLEFIDSGGGGCGRLLGRSEWDAGVEEDVVGAVIGMVVADAYLVFGGRSVSKKEEGTIIPLYGCNLCCRWEG